MTTGAETGVRLLPARGHQRLPAAKAGERLRADSPPGPPEGPTLDCSFDFKALASRIVEEQISVVLHQVWGDLLWQSQGTNTDEMMPRICFKK